MDCRKMEQLISPYMDGELTRAQAEAVRAHLAVCAHCEQEYQDMLLIAAACRQSWDMRTSIPAPLGFSTQVMAQIKNEPRAVSAPYSNWLVYHWKQAAAMAAAAVLMVWGSLSINLAPVVQIAENPAPVYQSGESSVPGSNPSQNTAGVPISGQNHTTTQNNQVTIEPGTGGTTLPATSAPVLMNKERYLVTTLLQVKVQDAGVAVAEATRLATTLQASTQNLGQQINAGGTYTVLKITVPAAASSQLLDQLSSLGAIAGREVSKQDITTSYADTLSQYQTLVSQQAALPDETQKQSLDARIASLLKDLQAWEQAANQETIVLWIEI